MVEPDDFETVVVFRMWKGEVIALFPEIPATYDGYDCQSFMHFGQHGAASAHGIVYSSRLATPEEYADVKQELEQQHGYRFKVRQRITQAMEQEREREQERHRNASGRKAQ